MAQFQFSPPIPSRRRRSPSDLKTTTSSPHRRRPSAQLRLGLSILILSALSDITWMKCFAFSPGHIVLRLPESGKHRLYLNVPRRTIPCYPSLLRRFSTSSSPGSNEEEEEEHQSSNSNDVDQNGLNRSLEDRMDALGSKSPSALEQLAQLKTTILASAQEQEETISPLLDSQPVSNSRDIPQNHIDDCHAILETNAKFYQAFRLKDFAAMKDLWLPDRSSTWIPPPPSKPIEGVSNILQAYETLFEKYAATMAYQKTWIDVENIRLQVQGSTAIVLCDEKVFLKRYIRGQQRQAEWVHTGQATNVFRKITVNSESEDGGARQQEDRWYLVHHHSSWHASSALGKAALKEVQPLTEVSKKNKQSPSSKSIQKILGKTTSAESAAASGPRASEFRIQDDRENTLSQKQEEASDGNTGEDDEEEEDINEYYSLLKKKNQQNTNAPKDAASPGTLRQNCLRLLRKLAIDGRISQHEKRLLQTDIIMTSAKGDYSMVEVAYELLVTESSGDSEDDLESIEQEFADQCRVFAKQLEDEKINRKRM